MQKLLLYISILSVLSFSLKVNAQQNPIDSLKAILEKTDIDTVKVNTLIELASVLRGRDNEQAFKYSEEALTLAEQVNYLKGIAEVNKTLGILYFMFGEFDKAYEATIESKKNFEAINDKKGVAACFVNTGIFKRNLAELKESGENFQKALEIYKEIDDKEGAAKTYLNLGNLYKMQFNLKMALDNYFQSLKFFEEVDNKYMVGQLYQNIGIVYSNQEDSKKALENYNEALVIFTKLDDIKGIAEVNNNIGNNYADEENYSLAIDYYLRALKLFKEMGYTPMIAHSYYNLGDANNKIKQYKDAKNYFDQSLDIYKNMNYSSGMALCYNGLGEYYYNIKEFKKAIEFLEKAKNISGESDIKITTDAVSFLHKTYAEIKDYKKAYENHLIFKSLNDSIFNENNEKALIAQSMQYEYEKQEKIREAKEKIEKENREAIQAEKDKTDKITKIGLSILVLAALLVAFISILSYRRKQKANKLLAAQKAEIESKNVELEQSNEEILAQRDEIEDKNVLITEQRDIAIKQKQEITDSIQYAQRIQEAVLPKKSMFVGKIKDYFIYFRPKDIVSGDFYWMTKIDNKLIVTAADCTGHGVPGAFMSLLGVSFLNEIVNKDHELIPGRILDKLRSKVIDSLNQREGESKDGMDMGISIIDTEKQEIQFAGAYNPMYIIPASTTGEYTINKIAADRMPIGIHLKMDKDFTNHVIKYNKGDSIYMFSDGYIDQFGGEKGRKLKSGKFQELLLNIQDKNMAQQKEILHNFLEKWKGNLEQLDDIIVIGMKL